MRHYVLGPLYTKKKTGTVSIFHVYMRPSDRYLDETSLGLHGSGCGHGPFGVERQIEKCRAENCSLLTEPRIWLLSGNLRAPDPNLLRFGDPTPDMP